MKLCRCLNCNKVLGEVEGKAKIKCKMAGCHTMNVIDTDAGTHVKDPLNEIAKEFIREDVRERLDYVPITYGKGIVAELIPLQLNGVSEDEMREKINLSFDESVEEYKRIHKDENDTAQRIMQANMDLVKGDWKKRFRPYEIK